MQIANSAYNPKPMSDIAFIVGVLRRKLLKNQLTRTHAAVSFFLAASIIFYVFEFKLGCKYG